MVHPESQIRRERTSYVWSIKIWKNQLKLLLKWLFKIKCMVRALWSLWNSKNDSDVDISNSCWNSRTNVPAVWLWTVWLRPCTLFGDVARTVIQLCCIFQPDFIRKVAVSSEAESLKSITLVPPATDMAMFLVLTLVTCCVHYHPSFFDALPGSKIILLWWSLNTATQLFSSAANMIDMIVLTCHVLLLDCRYTTMPVWDY